MSKKSEIMKKIITKNIKKAFCHHEWEFYADLTIAKPKQNVEYHNLTLQCKKCKKLKNLPPYQK